LARERNTEADFTSASHDKKRKRKRAQEQCATGPSDDTIEEYAVTTPSTDSGDERRPPAKRVRLDKEAGRIAEKSSSKTSTVPEMIKSSTKVVALQIWKGSSPRKPIVQPRSEREDSNKSTNLSHKSAESLAHALRYRSSMVPDSAIPVHIDGLREMLWRILDQGKAKGMKLKKIRKKMIPLMEEENLTVPNDRDLEQLLRAILDSSPSTFASNLKTKPRWMIFGLPGRGTLTRNHKHPSSEFSGSRPDWTHNSCRYRG
jgi:hypothetical protein